MTASILPLEAHNLDTTATSISFSSDFVSTMSQRPATKLPLVNPDDEFWVLLKTTPGPGTNTGVGGYQTFYVPEGVEILDTAYVLPDPSDPRTAYNFYGALRPPLVGPPSPMTKNSGDTVGEYFASNVPNAVTREVLGVMTQWDSQQLRAYGRSDVSPLLDSNGRGTAPWGLANVVPGPHTGYGVGVRLRRLPEHLRHERPENPGGTQDQSMEPD